jgi:hypothetical protein
MNHTDFLEHNKLSHLHDGKTIFFCKTDYLLRDFQTITKLNNEVVLITGNSDYPITDEIVSLAPKNIKKWYAVNALTHSNMVEPIPLGLENQYFSIRDDHGIGYPDRASLKESILQNLDKNYIPTQFLYCNFNITTNPAYRQKIYDMAKQLKYITLDSPILSLYDMFQKIQDHKMVLCPAGNGIDTHRLWEVLYCNRIPVTFKIANYKIYELYKKLPIIILENIHQLTNFKLLQNKYQQIINKKYNINILNIKYWKNKILGKINENLY